MDQSDEALMERVRDGDVDRLSALFDRHHRPLYQYLAHVSQDRDLAEDLVQEVFFRMLKYRQTYSAEGRFAAWMFQIARNTYVDHRRKRQVVEMPAPEAREFADQAPLADREMERGQEVALLRRALAALPEDKRELLMLSRFENLRYDEIAKILDCEVGAVKVRVFRAVKHLGQIYSRIAGRRAS